MKRHFVFFCRLSLIVSAQRYFAIQAPPDIICRMSVRQQAVTGKQPNYEIWSSGKRCFTGLSLSRIKIIKWGWVAISTSLWRIGFVTFDDAPAPLRSRRRALPVFWVGSSQRRRSTKKIAKSIYQSQLCSSSRFLSALRAVASLLTSSLGVPLLPGTVLPAADSYRSHLF